MNDTSNDVIRTVRKSMSGDKLPNQEVLNGAEVSSGSNYNTAVNSKLDGSMFINTANKKFGINGWSDHIVEVKEDCCEQLAGHHYQSICHSIIRVTLSTGVSHEELGFGCCTHSKREIAIERAMKSAIIDGRNRCLEVFLQNSNNTTFNNNNNNVKIYSKNNYINNNNNNLNIKNDTYSIKTNSITPKTENNNNNNNNQSIPNFIKSPYDISHIISSSSSNNNSPLLPDKQQQQQQPIRQYNNNIDSLRSTPNSQEIRKSVRKSITNVNTTNSNNNITSTTNTTTTTTNNNNKGIYTTPPQPIRTTYNNTIENNSIKKENQEEIINDEMNKDNDNSIVISQTVPTAYPVIQKNYYQKSPIPTKKPPSPPSSPNHKNPMKRSTIYPIPISNKRLSLGDNKNDENEDDLDQYLSELGSQTF